ncbi:hypothetical protein J6525_37455 [Bradyrhizobium sp. WSM 4400]|nr:hypothetical protein [Bradyrhizobium australafricanum]
MTLPASSNDAYADSLSRIAASILPLTLRQCIGSNRPGAVEWCCCGAARRPISRPTPACRMVESDGIDREQRADPVERAHRHRSGYDRGGIAVEHGNAGGGRMPIDASLEPLLELHKRHRG